MNLLLDTHVVLWLFSGSRPLSQGATRAIRDGNRVVYVSAATAWEIAIKKGLGKLRAPDAFLPALERYRFTPLDIVAEHALAVEHLEHHHRDPFDRLLIAQAKVEGVRLVTADARLAAYDVPLLRA